MVTPRGACFVLSLLTGTACSLAFPLSRYDSLPIDQDAASTLDGAVAETAPSDGVDAATDVEGGGTRALLGDTKIETVIQSESTGLPYPFAFRYRALASGTAQRLFFYIEGAQATTFDVAIYSDNGDAKDPVPLNQLTKATLSVAGVQQWNSVALPETAITEGSFYWIAFVSSRALYFRRAGGTTGTPESETMSSTKLSATWVSNETANNGPASLYVTE